MKIGLMIGVALGATAAAWTISNVNVSKIAKKTKKAVVHSLESMVR